MARRVKVEKPDIEQRVSVNCTYLDGNATDDAYSSYLDSSLKRLYGTTVFKYELKARVKWDIDGQHNDVLYNDLQIENDDVVYQVADAMITLPCSGGILSFLSTIYLLITMLPVNFFYDRPIILLEEKYTADHSGQLISDVVTRGAT